MKNLSNIMPDNYDYKTVSELISEAEKKFESALIAERLASKTCNSQIRRNSLRSADDYLNTAISIEGYAKYRLNR